MLITREESAKEIYTDEIAGKIYLRPEFLIFS
jgi:hypothetical protein